MQRRHLFVGLFGLTGAILTGLLVTGAGPTRAAEEPPNPKSQVGFYLKNYGGESDRQTDPQVKRTYEIFERVRQVTDNLGQRLPQLKIVNSDNNPWAIALPDGFIVLSRRAVEIAYRDARPEEGEARIAFILGHELAHLNKDDFWHLNVYSTLADDPDPEAARLRRDLETGSDATGARSAARMKEAQADDQGFVYAALAGYRVDTLLDQADTGKEDFFHYWMTQTQTSVDDAHPSPPERAKLIRTRLGEVHKKLEFFYYGVRLTHFGAYEDAEYFLREFQHVFAGREVANNLGYGYLQRARRLMPTSLAYRYCLPTLLDTETRVATLALRSGEAGTATELSDQARDLLKVAVDNFKRATEADATYLPARLNLAATYFYLGEIYHARAVIEEAFKLAPADGEVQNLRALILYQEGWNSDTWPKAVEIMESLVNQPQPPVCLTYNLAQILDERQRHAKAEAVWKTLVGRLAELPAPYRQRVCQSTPQAPACKSAATVTPVAVPPWPLPVKPGQEAQSRLFADWTASAFNWQQDKLAGHLYRGPQGVSALELDGYIEMVVLQRDGLGTEDRLRACCGNPTLKQAVTGGTLWSYGDHWAALLRDGQVAEVWVHRQPVQP